RGAPDGVVAGRETAADHHAIAVGQSSRTGGVGADVVAFDHVGGCAVGDIHTRVHVAGDDIAGPWRRYANRVIGRGVHPPHTDVFTEGFAVLSVSQRAGIVSSYVVAFDQHVATSVNLHAGG